MNITDAAKLLTVCAAYDRRKPDEDQAQAWALALNGLDFLPCRDAIVAHYQESREWIMPADIRGRVRRARAAAISHDEALELPPHDPDDTELHMRLLVEARAEAAEGRTYQPTGLVRRNLRELGGPVRRVSDLDAETNAAHAERTKQIHRDNAVRQKHRRDVAPAPPIVFACEHVDGDATCGQPATKTTPDRRRPACDVHAEPVPDTHAATSHDTEGAHT